MSKTWIEMIDHERNTLVAEAMGWREPFIIDPAGELWGHHPTGGYQAVPPFIIDYTACRLVEDEIERRGLVFAYIEQLCIIVGLSVRSGTFFGEHTRWEQTNAEIWQIARATSEQRCHAAVRAMGVEV